MKKIFFHDIINYIMKIKSQLPCPKKRNMTSIREGVSSKKMKVNLHITEKCNYHCKYCFAKFGKHKDLDILQWKYIIDNLKSSNIVDKINFAGGEPIFYYEFPNLVDYAHKQRLSLSIISNGSTIQVLSLILSINLI